MSMRCLFFSLHIWHAIALFYLLLHFFLRHRSLDAGCFYTSSSDDLCLLVLVCASFVCLRMHGFLFSFSDTFNSLFLFVHSHTHTHTNLGTPAQSSGEDLQRYIHALTAERVIQERKVHEIEKKSMHAEANK